MNGAEANRRFFVLDIIRGLAVLLMVLAHSVYFFHNGTNLVLLDFEKIGNILAFTTFLIVSGASIYIAYFRDGEMSEVKRKKLLKRIFILLFSYYILAIIIESKSIISADSISGLKQILDILIFKTTPSYTQFIPPFIFFSLFVYFFPRFFYSTVLSNIKSVFFAAYIFLTGIAISFVTIPEILKPLKLHLVGDTGVYRFPLLYYFPVFLLGAVWGCWLVTKKHHKHKEEIVKFLSLISAIGIITVIVVLIFNKRNLDVFNLRWPPSVPFLSIGIFFTFITATLLYKLKQLKRFPLIRDIFLLLGQNAYGIFWSNTLILNIYLLSGGTRLGSTVIFFGLFLASLLTAVAISTFVPFNSKFALTFHNKDHEEEDALLHSEPLYRMGDEIYSDARYDIKKLRSFFFPKHTGGVEQERLIKKRHFLLGAILTVAISIITLPSFSEEAQKLFSPKNDATWFSEDYTYRSQINIENLESFSVIPKESALKLSIDHKALVSQGKANSDGSDLKIAYWDGEKYIDIAAYSNNWNQNPTRIYFLIPEKIGESENIDNFYMYYGNGVSEKASSKKTFKEWEYKYNISLSAEEAHNPLLKVNKIWNLKLQEKEELPVSLKVDNPSTYKRIIVNIINTNISSEIEQDKVSDEWNGNINIESLKPGKYQAQATLEKEDGQIKSQKTFFIVSYPLYITWTIDWEGFDAPNDYVDAMSQTADTHNIPMTHLFNPRIFVSSAITPQRAQYQKDWVLSRAKYKNEEIGLHLHWYDDFVSSAGVEVKKQYNWGNTGVGAGYETLPSNFSKEELVKMLTYAKQLFKNNGLPNPTSYRAGGWFADINLLNALDETGFKIDTSGKTRYSFGPNNTEGYWNLSETQGPFHPSKTNQNMELESNLKLWEAPNNGIDSYWHSDQEMIKRFIKNYSGGILEKPTQVTFLSHPNWFNAKEKQRMENVLNFTDNYVSSKDKGPGIYVTLGTIYKEWLSKE